MTQEILEVLAADERLKDFPTKPSPTVSDILFIGDASASYNEVQSTIAQLATALTSNNIVQGSQNIYASNNGGVSDNLVSLPTIVSLQSQINGKLNLSGGTMTGFLTLNADPITNLEATTKQYTDSGLATKLNLSGGTMTGFLTLNADPTTNLESATKQYVDNGLAVKLNLSGGTMTGPLILNSDPTTAFQATTKQYTDNGLSTKLNLSGGTITGTLNITNGSGSTLSIFGSNTNAIIQANTTTKGILTSLLNSSQETTLLGLLGSGDIGLQWFNTTNSTNNYWNGSALRQSLAIENCIAGTNMTLDKSVPGQIIFNSSGGGSLPAAAISSFSIQNNPGNTTFAAANTFYPVNLGATFSGNDSSNFTNQFMTISGLSTPVMTCNSSVTQFYNVNVNLGMRGVSLSGSAIYIASLYIRTSGGTINPTPYRSLLTLVDPVNYYDLSITGNVELNNGDSVFVEIQNITNTNSVSVYYATYSIVSLAGSIPNTDGLPQGTNNIFLSTNSGSTYEFMSGSGTIGNLPKFNSAGGRLIDSGIPASNVVLTTGNQTIAGIKTFTGGELIYQPSLVGDGSNIILENLTYNVNNLTDQGAGTDIYQEFFFGTEPSTHGFCSSWTTGFNYENASGSSGYLNYEIMDKGNRNFVWQIRGGDASFGARAIFGGTTINGTLKSFSIGLNPTDSPKLGALFEVSSTTQGAMIPTMTNAQMNSINVSDTPTSLFVYTTDTTKGFHFWDTAWNLILSNANVTGNVTFSSSGVSTIGSNQIVPGMVSSGTYGINISGTATTATNSNNIATTSVTTNATYYPLFVASSTNSNQAPDLSTGFTFNPSTNILSTTGLNLSGLTANSPIFTDSSKNLTSSGTVPFANGGFGFTTATTGDLFYASGTNTPGKLSDVATGSVLTSGGVGVVPTWSSSPTLTGLNLSGLSASQAVVTDSSKNLASLQYTSSNTASTLVERDSSGNFSAGTITAALSGNSSSATQINTTATTTNSTFYLTFVASPSSGNQSLDMGSTLTYNPSTGLVTATSLTLAAANNLNLGNNVTNVLTINSATGANNRADISLNRFDSTNGNNRLIYSTAGTSEWSVGQRSGSQNYVVFDEINSLAQITVSQGSGTSGVVNIAGGLVVGATGQTAIQFANGTAIAAKNSGGTLETWCYPRFSDNRTYMDIGSAGLTMRQNAAGTTWMTVDTSGNLSFAQGNASITTAAKTFGLKSGANGSTGSVTFSGGSATISTTAAAANDRVQFMLTTSSNPGFINVSISAGVGYTLTSSNILDASTCNWFRLLVA